MADRSFLSKLLFGGVALLSIGSLFFFLFRRSSRLSITNAPASNNNKKSEDLKNIVTSTKPEVHHDTSKTEEEEDDEDEEEEEEEEEEIQESPVKAAPAVAQESNTVENNSSTPSQSSEKDSDRPASSEDDLKTSYDTAVRLARKLLDGQSYDKAAAKYSEALELANKLPTAAKDILTLYNNRSATYEKSGDYSKSLNDIAVVLAMDPKHIKAHMRKARVLEAQGKFKEALFENVHAMILEQVNGQQPSNALKIDEINKIVARGMASKIVEKMRKSVGRALPTKAYCRNFFESLPSVHQWRLKYQNGNKSNKEDLVSAFEAALNPREDGEVVDPKRVLSKGLEVVYFSLSHGLFTRAFDAELPRLSSIAESEETAQAAAEDFQLASDLSIYFELVGTNYHLRCNLAKAIEYYKKAWAFDSSNFEAALKLASVNLELGEVAEAESLFETALNLTSNDETGDAKKAWIYTHRSTLWTTRDEKGQFISGAVEKATSDINKSLELTAGASDLVTKKARVSALLKAIQATTQVKAQMGEQPTLEELEKNKEQIREAKELDPTNETVAFMEADLTAAEGDMDKALEIINATYKNSDPDDGIPHVIRANILTQQAFQFMNNAQMSGNAALFQMAQGQFMDASASYEEALRVEPISIEALTQYAQLKQMLGDSAGAVGLSEKALEYGRSKDEVQELCQLFLMAQAQEVALKEIQSQSSP